MNQLRIIGGQWRSRRLPIAELPGLRPTPDRVRETLFNWLGQDLDGLRCLDLFAGSGALGFEAASRGAAEVVMVEYSPVAAAVLQKGAATLGARNVRVVKADALNFLRTPGNRFDVVFLDPPYRQDWLSRVEPLLSPWLAEDAQVYVEAEQPMPAFAGLAPTREGKAGQVCYQLFRRDDGA
ncbi:MAG: 16S rRNA (guanine(966)-N(2))-methyltransferase RsmD [Moraxellaceae bacterium]|nr:16S rRNA (guanine(966)-N(2))-methyltransferase RsmD [Moraxellaceae bacterium]